MVTMMARPLGAAALVLLLVVSLTASSCAAHDFYVGGRDGWTTNPSEPHNHWAERNRFQVNDTLVFRYDKDVDGVLRVTQSHYDACDTTDPILRLNGGDSRFVFPDSGPYFFISADAERCKAGERLIVVVLTVRSPPLPPSPPPKSTSSSPPPPPPTPKPASPSSSSAPLPPTPKSASSSSAPPPPAPNPASSSSTPPPPAPKRASSLAPPPYPPVPSPATHASPPPPSPSSANVSSPLPAPLIAPMPAAGMNGTYPPPSKSSAVALRTAGVLACLIIGGAAILL